MPERLHELGPLLIANRGEIAVRVLRTAHRLGLRTVAVFVEADRGALHADLADLAVRVESYLDGQALIDAARRAGARAVHPGYGFLSENAGFARAVDEAGLVWVGPPPAAIDAMGDKGRAKQLALEAGVPVVPGTGVAAAGAAEVAGFAAEHGYPVLIKAVAGGGGKGMRVIAGPDELESAIASASREAEAAFGDGRVLAERYLERPRHVEVQVLADAHGTTLALGERECSLQRRHQKVVEEAPSPALSAPLRERIAGAAVALSQACGYRGAGTVELLVPSGADPSEFHFLEMNTRLQVEHPVTELVWGVDLVEQQLRIAAGEPLAPAIGELRPRGHAVEARVYAEDPGKGFLPATGTVRRWRPPAGEGIRVDTGIREGSRVGTEFDPMLAKVIAHGPDRETALARLERALADLELLGVANSAAFSRRLLGLDQVRRGELDTGLLERLLEAPPPVLDPEAPEDLLAAAAAYQYLRDTEDAGLAPGPWRRRFDGHGEVRIAAGRLQRERLDAPFAAELLPDGYLRFELAGISRVYAHAEEAGREVVWVGSEGAQLELRSAPRTRPDSPEADGSLEAPMPGKVLGVAVEVGDRVAPGDVLVVLESMKMELQVTAPAAGTVVSLGAAPGEQVSQGQLLVAVAADEGSKGGAG